MRSPKLIVAVFFLLVVMLCTAQPSLSQYSINSIAGGGPNNITALLSSIGYAGSVARDAGGNIYIADSYSSHIFKVDTSGNLTVVAGNGTLGYSGDGGPATSAALNRPEGVFVDGSGNIFIADTDNSVIREVLAASGNIQTVAGNGNAGYGGDGAAATSAELNDPFGVFVDGTGNIFIADTDNSVIREVVASSGSIQTVAGNATPGYSGDGTPATSAQLDEPEGVSLDVTGNIFIADTYNSVIREVTIATGQIHTVAGTYYAYEDSCNYSGDDNPAISAQLCLPSNVFVDGSSNLFIADTGNSVIREVLSAGSTIQTVAGNGTLGYAGDGGAATSAELNNPSSMVVDTSGNIYIADTDNFVVRELSSGNIQTIIGNNTLAYSGDNGPATNAALNYPGQVFVDASGNVYIADSENSVIRVVNTGSVAVTIAGVTIQPGAIETVAGNGTACPTSNPGCGDGGLATAANLNLPYGLFVDGSGNIFIADTANSVIREVVAATGDIQTVAGNYTSAFAGDGDLASGASLYNPYGVLLDGHGNVYIADTENSAIRVVNTGAAAITIAGITIQPGDIETVAGTGGTACTDSSEGCGDGGAATSAELKFPGGIALDSTGDIYIADSDNNAIREVNAMTGIIQTVAGTLGQRGYSGDNGAPTSALLNTPENVVLDSFGNLFIADSQNSVIREVVAVGGIIVTVAGTNIAGFSGDGGSSSSAELNDPLGVAVVTTGSLSGTLFVADTDNSRIRELTSTTSVTVVPSSATVPVGSSGTQQFAASVSISTSTAAVKPGIHKNTVPAAKQATSLANTSVTWQVNGVTGGNATWGTISNTGLYEAPTNLPTSTTVTVTAISNANGTAFGSAKVLLAGSGTSTITVSSTPSGVTEVYTGTSQSFTAALNGSASSAVNWQASCVGGGNSNCGTITGGGVYTAPAGVPSNPLILVTATSQASASVSGSYPFTIAAVPAATTPAPQTISPGQFANYSFSLNANTGNPKQPITLSCLQSSLPPGATCAFTPLTITPGTKAVPFSLIVKVPSGTSSSASLQRPAKLLMASQFYYSFLPLAGILLFAGNSRKQRGRWLLLALLCVLPLVMTACGGGGGGSSPGTNPELGTYTIQVQGTTATQPNPVTITTAGLTVQ
jgi:hypothetical protein